MDEKKAHLVWQGQDLNFGVTLGSGYQFAFRSPPDGEGGSPMEIMLATAAGCTAMDVVSMLQKMRQPLTGFEVDITGLRAEEHPKVYTQATITYVFHGADLDPKSIERAIELSQTKYCSVSIMFKRAGVEVQWSYRIEP